MSGNPITPVMEWMIDGEWVDVTDDIRLNSAHSGGGISIKRGVPNEGNSAEPTELDFTLNNAMGVYSPKNPHSIYYRKLGRNTPVRFALRRFSDPLTRTETDGWGRLPDWTDAENATIQGDRWTLTGGGDRFDMTASGATIGSGSGYTMAGFGTWGDVDVLTKVKISNLTSEFGIVLRMKNPEVGYDDFETGLNGWTPTGTNTLVLSSTQKHSGSQAAFFTVAGSPSTASARSSQFAVVPGGAYKLRGWVRCSASRNVTLIINWLDTGGSTVSSSSTTTAVTANTWTLIQVDGTCPDGADFVKWGADMASSPSNGTSLYIDDIGLNENDGFSAYTAYISPGTPDLLRVGQIVPGSAFATWTSQTSNVATGTWYWMRAQMTGIRARVKIWEDGDPEPSTWGHSWADTGATTATFGVPPPTGQVGLFTKDGSATVTFGSIQVSEYRAHAEVANLPQKWDLSRTDRWVPIQARGILRRLGQGRKALDSPVTLHLHEYSGSRMWFTNESTDASSTLISNLAEGAPPAQAKNLSHATPDAAGTFALPGVSGYINFDQDDSQFQARAGKGAAPGIWSILVFWRVPDAPASSTLLYRVESTGTARAFLFTINSDRSVSVSIQKVDGTVLDSDTAHPYPGTDDLPLGAWIAANLYVFDSGGTVTWAWNFHRPGGESFYTVNGTYSGSAGTFSGILFKSSSVLTGAGNLQVAQIFHYPGDLPFVTVAFARAAYAYIGEEAITRWLRLCQNAGIKATTTGVITGSKTMGAQTPSKLLDLLDECAEADDSRTTEERDDFALCLRTRDSQYNQVPMVLDIDEGHLTDPLDPADDDQRTRNDVTVSRPSGGSARSVQTEGPLNVNAPEDDPDGVGTYDEGPDFNYDVDSELQPMADWRRAKGTIDEPRYPSMHANLRSSIYDDQAVAAELRAKDSGDMLLVYNAEIGYDPSHQIVQGYTEDIDQYDHDITFTTNPGAVWYVGVMQKTTRLQTRYQTLDSDFDAGTDTRLFAARTLPGALWVQVADSPQSFPFVIEVEGSQLRVHAVGDVLNDNPYFDEGITGYQSDTAVTLYWDRKLGNHKSGIASLRCTATSTGGVAAVVTAAHQTDIDPSTDYQVSCWIKSSIATTVGVGVAWYKANGTTLSTTSFPTAISVAANTWTPFSQVFTSPADGQFARLRPALDGAAVGTQFWVDDLRIMPVDSYEASPQTLSVDQDPVNGVIKTLAADAAITVVDPWRMAF